MSVTLTLPTLVDYQTKALFCKERFAVVEGSTKCGKTFPCIIWILHECCKTGQDGRNYWWVAPIFEQARIAYRRMKTMLNKADPLQTIWQQHEQEMAITIKGRGRIVFKSGDNPDSLYGEDVFAAVIDEASRCKEESWHAVRSTLTATGGPCRIIGNVRGRKNWAYAMARRAESGAQDMHYAKITCGDAVEAGLIPQEEIEQARRDLPDWVFRELYMSEPSEDGANPFGLQHIAACVGEMSTERPVVFGVDLAKSVDWTVVVGLDSRGRTCRFDRWQRVPWQETQARILDMIGETPTLVDSTGVGDAIVEDLTRANPMVSGLKFTASTKQQLMEGLAVAIQSRRIAFPDGVIRRELEEFEFVIAERTGRVSYSAPSGMHDDCVCAIALAYRHAQFSLYEVSATLSTSRTVSPIVDQTEFIEAVASDEAEYRQRFLTGV